MPPSTTPGQGSTASTTGATNAPATTMAPPATTGSATSGFTGGAQTGPMGQVALASTGPSLAPVEKSRSDPFKMLNPPRPPRGVQIKPPEFIPYPTWLILPRKPLARADDTIAAAEADTTQRRMAGILYGGAVSAILETGTDSIVVKPGDIVENGTMRVDRIEPDCIVLRALVGKPRTVQVRMAASQNVAAAPAPTPTAGPPRGIPPRARGPLGRGGSAASGT